MILQSADLPTGETFYFQKPFLCSFFPPSFLCSSKNVLNIAISWLSFLFFSLKLDIITEKCSTIKRRNRNATKKRRDGGYAIPVARAILSNSPLHMESTNKTTADASHRIAYCSFSMPRLIRSTTLIKIPRLIIMATIWIECIALYKVEAKVKV